MNRRKFIKNGLLLAFLIVLISQIFIGKLANAGKLRVLPPFISVTQVGDGLIGSTSAVGNTIRLYTGNLYGSLFTPASYGNVRYGYADITNDGSSITLCMSLLDSSGNELISKEVAISHSGNTSVEFDMGSTYELVSPNTYYLGIQTNTTFAASNGLTRDNQVGNTDYKAQAYSCGSGFSSPSDLNSYNFRLYMNNTGVSPY